MSINRRKAIISSAALLLSGWGSARVALAAESPAVAFLDKSNLIYLSPLLADGQESTCHGEVWFVHYMGEIFVVTPSDAWRAEAVRRGLRRAAIWIGEFGAWKKAENRYRSAAHLTIEGRIEVDAAVHDEILGRFGVKYVKEWGTWGPRFRTELADGSRVMLRYQVVS
ncbi:MAG: hypothetical protein E2O36_03250 [Proteobacteria bacterium]|nr:MAG: hypothetical protein E2O36_03250 [Pseudomonadota bacterium]